MREDFWIYALDETPQGVGKLETDTGPVKVGERVALLGVQERGKRDEDNLFGSVVTSTPTRIEVDLDLPGTLRGWGGAIMSTKSWPAPSWTAVQLTT